MEFGEVVWGIVMAEVAKGRYIGPFTQKELEDLIGPFQTSPLSVIPKLDRPDKHQLIQNLLYPYSLSTAFPNPAINSNIDSTKFPCTWGTFAAVSLVIQHLPPGSQAAVRDVAEAYCTIPLHSSHWPAVVVRTREEEFHINTSLCFGAQPSSGRYGHLEDSAVELY